MLYFWSWTLFLFQSIWTWFLVLLFQKNNPFCVCLSVCIVFSFSSKMNAVWFANPNIKRTCWKWKIATKFESTKSEERLFPCNQPLRPEIIKFSPVETHLLREISFQWVYYFLSRMWISVFWKSNSRVYQGQKGMNKPICWHKEPWKYKRVCVLMEIIME